jgi:hypothetical protein
VPIVSGGAKPSDEFQGERATGRAAERSEHAACVILELVLDLSEIGPGPHFCSDGALSACINRQRSTRLTRAIWK